MVVEMGVFIVELEYFILITIIIIIINKIKNKKIIIALNPKAIIYIYKMILFLPWLGSIVVCLYVCLHSMQFDRFHIYRT